jgi:hypothetical protein
MVLHIYFLLKGMDEVGLHRFLGRCESKVIESIFPMTDQLFISYEELKEVMVFEDTEGREETITYWHNYLAYLSKYEPGTILYGCRKYDVTFFNATK